MHAFYKVRKDLHEEWFGRYDTYLVWWCDLLYHAAWKSKSVSIQNRTIILHPGEQVASISDLMKRWNRGKDMIINFIGVLKDKGLIEKRSANNISIIRIIGYNSDAETDNLSIGLADNLEPGKNHDVQTTIRDSQWNKADNPSEETTDNPIAQTDNLADSLADNSSVEDTDNLETTEFTDEQRGLRNSRKMMTDNPSMDIADNLADNLADTTPIYKEERKEISTTARDNINDMLGEGISIDAAIERLLADEVKLFKIQHYTGISKKEIILWSSEYVERCEIQKGGYNTKGYDDVVMHYADWLQVQKSKGKSPRLKIIHTEAQAQEIWNKVQARFVLRTTVPKEIIVSLEFNEYDPKNQTIGIIAPNNETKAIINKEYKAKIEKVFSRYTSTSIRVRCGVIEPKGLYV